MTDLRMSLEVATDQIDSPDLARAALAAARRRRTRRRGAVAGIATGLAVTAVVVIYVGKGRADAYGWIRIWETFLGAVVTMASAFGRSLASQGSLTRTASAECT